MAQPETLSPDRKPALFADMVLGELRSAGRPLTGLQIRDRLAGCGRIVRPPQVYRAVSQLVDQGDLLHIRTTSSYMPRPAEQSIVLICRKCGDHKLARAGKTPERCTEHARKRQFDARQIVLEVAGLCTACHAEKAGEQAKAT